MTALTLVADAAEAPVTLAEAKLHLKLDGAEDDALVEALIGTAAEACRAFTGRELVERTWRLSLDEAPGEVVTLPKPPLRAVISIIAYDEADQAMTMAPGEIFVDAASIPGRVIRRRGAAWPIVGRVANGLAITFLAGYGPRAADVPAPLRQGMLALIADRYEHRESWAGDVPPPAARALWQPYRLTRLWP
jgi:uncharacterized phiE125 gp8 family phage protein